MNMKHTEYSHEWRHQLGLHHTDAEMERSWAEQEYIQEQVASSFDKYVNDNIRASGPAKGPDEDGKARPGDRTARQRREKRGGYLTTGSRCTVDDALGPKGASEGGRGKGAGEVQFMEMLDDDFVEVQGGPGSAPSEQQQQTTTDIWGGAEDDGGAFGDLLGGDSFGDLLDGLDDDDLSDSFGTTASTDTAAGSPVTETGLKSGSEEDTGWEVGDLSWAEEDAGDDRDAEEAS